MNVNCIACQEVFDNEKFNDCPFCDEILEEKIEEEEISVKVGERLADFLIAKPDRREAQAFKDKFEEILKPHEKEINELLLQLEEEE